MNHHYITEEFLDAVQQRTDEINALIRAQRRLVVTNPATQESVSHWGMFVIEDDDRGKGADPLMDALRCHGFLTEFKEHVAIGADHDTAD